MGTGGEYICNLVYMYWNVIMLWCKDGHQFEVHLSSKCAMCIFTYLIHLSVQILVMHKKIKIYFFFIWLNAYSHQFKCYVVYLSEIGWIPLLQDPSLLTFWLLHPVNLLILTTVQNTVTLYFHTPGESHPSTLGERVWWVPEPVWTWW
jgi:hypothetical protein